MPGDLPPRIWRVISQAATATTAHRWERWEYTMTSSTSYADPYRDVVITANFSGPGGHTFSTKGFWDGGNIYKIRAAFPTTGIWHWSTTPSVSNAGLTKSGSVTVSPYGGSNVLFQKGFLKVAASRRYLTYDNNEKFLWMGDTAWNVIWRSTLAEFRAFADDRANKGFTVLQIHATRTVETGGATNFLGAAPFVSNKPNPAYWQDMDAKIQYANAKGLYVYLIGLGRPQTDDFSTLMATNVFAQYIVGRLYGNFVIFSPSMDRPYTGYPENDQMGTWIDQVTTRHLISQHVKPGVGAGAAAYHGKPYLDFTSYQSGHGTGNIESAHVRRNQWNGLYTRTAVHVDQNAYKACDQCRVHV